MAVERDLSSCQTQAALWQCGIGSSNSLMHRMQGAGRRHTVDFGAVIHAVVVGIRNMRQRRVNLLIAVRQPVVVKVFQGVPQTVKITVALIRVVSGQELAQVGEAVIVSVAGGIVNQWVQAVIGFPAVGHPVTVRIGRANGLVEYDCCTIAQNTSSAPVS